MHNTPDFGADYLRYGGGLTKQQIDLTSEYGHWVVLAIHVIITLQAFKESVYQGIEEGWYYFWDVLAVVGTARPEILACREERVEVVLAEGPELGRTRSAEGGLPVCVGDDINREAFEDHLLAAILD